ncbi:MAG: PAAR domain-containing protein [Deltaproteobacteria bacterium]|jgi:uncharacterized Zn-binding protein involved in type VI secretion|nr:PAAR domain-containing protein [Deltaproteobacteria bacterium]
MPPVSRVGDKAECPRDEHGAACCAHAVSGPAVSGSPNVYVNNRPVLRVGDHGTHAACCGSNTWVNAQGSRYVRANGIPVARLGDATTHCGGAGRMVEGSPDVSFD